MVDTHTACSTFIFLPETTLSHDCWFLDYCYDVDSVFEKENLGFDSFFFVVAAMGGAIARPSWACGLDCYDVWRR
jgi:hypothetical protein